MNTFLTPSDFAQDRVSRALVVVGRDDTRVVALAGRVVLAGLTGSRARAAVGQADVCVRRADHGDRAVRCAVEDRNSISAAPELKVPMTPTTLEFCAYAFAFADALPESHLPACAVESSQLW